MPGGGKRAREGTWWVIWGTLMKRGGDLHRDPAAAPFTVPGTLADRSFMPQREHRNLLFNTLNVGLLFFSFLIAGTKYLTRSKMKGGGVQRRAARCGQKWSLRWCHSCTVFSSWWTRKPRHRIVGARLVLSFFSFDSGQDPSPWMVPLPRKARLSSSLKFLLRIPLTDIYPKTSFLQDAISGLVDGEDERSQEWVYIARGESRNNMCHRLIWFYQI